MRAERKCCKNEYRVGKIGADTGEPVFNFSITKRGDGWQNVGHPAEPAPGGRAAAPGPPRRGGGPRLPDPLHAPLGAGQGPPRRFLLLLAIEHNCCKGRAEPEQNSFVTKGMQEYIATNGPDI